MQSHGGANQGDVFVPLKRGAAGWFGRVDVRLTCEITCTTHTCFDYSILVRYNCVFWVRVHSLGGGGIGLLSFPQVDVTRDTMASMDLHLPGRLFLPG